jgi:hypothetical protein
MLLGGRSFQQQRSQLRKRPRVENVTLRKPCTPPRLHDTPAKVRQSVATMGVRRNRHEYTCLLRLAACRVVEVEPLRLSIEIQPASPLSRMRDDPVEIEFHRITLEQQASRRMREDRNIRPVQRPQDAFGDCPWPRSCNAQPIDDLAHALHLRRGKACCAFLVGRANGPRKRHDAVAGIDRYAFDFPLQTPAGR